MFHLFIVLQFPRVAALTIHIAILGQNGHIKVIIAVRLVRTWVTRVTRVAE